MAWVRLDDRWRTHDKMLRAIHLAGSQLVKWLWVEGLSECADNSTDGLLAVYRLDLVADAAGIPKSKARRDQHASALVAAGLWHTHDTIDACGACTNATRELGIEIAPGDVYVHDFTDFQPTKEERATPEARRRLARKNALRRDDALRQTIYERDQGLCRYCGIRVDTNPHNKSGHNRITYDHVDPSCFEPNLGNTTDAVVVACGRCNRRKADRTPLEAGMDLLAPGTTALDVAHGEHTTVTSGDPAGSDLSSTQPGPSQETRGSDRVGTGSGPGRSRVASGRAGKGRSRGRGGTGAATTPRRPKEPP